ncbi:hypothetical protein PG987_014098 [Apiospora arundinis]
MRCQSLFMLLPLLGSSTFASPTGSNNPGVSSSSPLLEARQRGSCTCPQPDGEFPNPCRCSQYLRCTNNVPIIGVCMPGQLYDSVLGLCYPERIARCAPKQDCCSS